MIEAISNAFKVSDLRKKILFTLAMVAIYRFGSQLPVPGVKIGELKQLFAGQGGILGLVDLFSGGALSNFAVFALGIMPYITAAIIMELLTVVIPTLERWRKEGEVGQKKITQVTRYATLGLSLVESVGYTVLFQTLLKRPFPPLQRFLIILTLTTGAVLVMWLGELITQHGIGNGMSLIIFIAIVSRVPVSVTRTAVVSPLSILGVIVLVLVITLAIVIMELGQRRISVQYAKRVVGRKVYGGGATYIPLKINSANVIPIIFAVAILLFPLTLAKFFPGSFFDNLQRLLTPGSLLRVILMGGMIIFFTYFYTAIIFNPIDVADNIKKYGGFIPGVRPGKPTAIYLNKVLNRITLPGSLFLATIAIIPEILGSQLGMPFFQSVGGISLIIIVGVALETMMQLETQLLQRHYEGFMK
jgi:preprotein translocase subunit SecY